MFDNRRQNSNSLLITASRSELEGRVAKVRGAMESLGVDVAVVTAPNAVFYLSGIWTGWFHAAPILVLTADDHKVLARQLDVGWERVWAHQTWATKWVYYRDEDDIPAAAGKLARQLCRRADPVLGLELNTPVATERFAATAVRSAGARRVVDLQPSMVAIRSVKSPTEIDHLRRSAALTQLGMEAARDTIAGGGLDTEAASAAFAAMVAAGSEPFAFNPIVVSGPLNRAVHIPWGRTRPEEGEPTTVMLGGVVGGYAAPLERTFFKGRMPDLARRFLSSVAEAVEAVLTDLRPGMTGAEVDGLARAAHEKNGLGKCFLHRTGYSIGINWADLELMQLHPSNKTQVVPGMTFHLVPHLMDADLGLLAISQPILVTEEGCERLLNFPLIVDTL
jgi:Xaa-Pro dipeptidase